MLGGQVASKLKLNFYQYSVLLHILVPAENHPDGSEADSETPLASLSEASTKIQPRLGLLWPQTLDTPWASPRAMPVE